MIKLIQVGLGPWGRSWAEAVLPDADVEVVAVVDTDPAVLPAERGFTSLEEALGTTEADAVLATVAINAHTPGRARRPARQKAPAAGKAVRPNAWRGASDPR